MKKVIMPADEYHSAPELSRSQLFELRKSPVHFKYALDNPAEPSPAMVFGSAFHCLILEPEKFDDEYITGQKIDRRTREGKEQFQRALDSGKSLISWEDYALMLEMKESVMNNRYACKLLSGEKERSYFWTDELTGIDLKCRPDCRTELKNTSVIVDLKTCESAATDDFMRDALKYGYDLQAAQYTTGVDLIESKPHRFVFIAVEKKPPYGLNILEANELFIRKGYDDFRYYLGAVAECTKSGSWYGYTGAMGIPNTLGLPSWLAKEYE